MDDTIRDGTEKIAIPYVNGRGRGKWLTVVRDDVAREIVVPFNKVNTTYELHEHRIGVHIFLYYAEKGRDPVMGRQILGYLIACGAIFPWPAIQALEAHYTNPDAPRLYQ